MPDAPRHGFALARALRAAAAALACALVLAATGAMSASAAPTSVGRALDYLHACQRSDGGFAEMGKTPSSDAVTAWAVVAIASAGEDPETWKVGGKSPLDHLAGDASAWKTTTDYARTVLAVVAAGRDPRSFGGVDLVGKILADVHDRGDEGDQIGTFVNSHVWGMLALEAAGQDVSGAETKWLLRAQNADGGWGWAPGVASDTNDTAAALEALIAAGQSSSSSGVKNALDYLDAHQVGDGGFSYQSGTVSDANSTAWVTQALVAVGEAPSTWQVGGHDPLDRLRALQNADGSVRYRDTANTNALLVTVQALPAFAQYAFPLKARSLHKASTFRPSVAPAWPADGGSVVWQPTSALSFAVRDGAGVGTTAGDIVVTVDGKRRSVKLQAGIASAALTSLSLGTHRVQVTATDKAGNVSPKRAWSFKVISAAVAAAASASSNSTASQNATSSSVSTTALSATGTPAAVASATAQAFGAPSANASSGTVSLPVRAGAPSPVSAISLVVGLASLAAVVGLVGWKFLGGNRREIRLK